MLTMSLNGYGSSSPGKKIDLFIFSVIAVELHMKRRYGFPINHKGLFRRIV